VEIFLNHYPIKILKTIIIFTILFEINDDNHNCQILKVQQLVRLPGKCSTVTVATFEEKRSDSGSDYKLILLNKKK